MKKYDRVMKLLDYDHSHYDPLAPSLFGRCFIVHSYAFNSKKISIQIIQK